MNVGDLQRYLTLQAECLDLAKAAKAAKDLRDIAGRLESFATLNLDTFFSFLQRAYSYHSTGVLPAVPVPPAKRPAKRPAKSPAGPKLTLTAALESTRRLYEQSVQLSAAEFQQGLDLLQSLAKLTKNDLLKIAEALDLFGLKNRKKDDILQQIQWKIAQRRGTAQRAEMVSPPS